MKLFGKHIAAADLALLLAGVLGVLAYVLLLPGQHPDSTARYAFDAEAAEEHARTFLEAHGYPTGNLDLNQAQFKRNKALVVSLQRAMGRQDAIRLLADSSGTWPAYYWDVHFGGSVHPDAAAQGRADEDETDEDEEETTFHLHLTQHGAVSKLIASNLRLTREVAFDEPNAPQRLLRRHLDRRALTAALRKTEGQSLSNVPDSLLARSLTFGFTGGKEDSLKATSDSLMVRDIVAALKKRLKTDGSIIRFRVPDLKREDAERLARFHLRKTPLGALFSAQGGLRADSVWMPAASQGRVAAVRFQTKQRGQTVRADVEVFATGGLRALDTTFNPDTHTHDGEMTLRSWVGIAGMVLIVLIGIGLLVAFFRRISERMIDVRTGIIDAVVLGSLIIGLLFVFGDATFSSGDASMWQRIMGIVVGGGTVFAMFTLFAFPFVAAADAVGRSAFAEKMLSVSMVRRLSFRNQYVGAALLRGLGLAGTLLGVGALMLVLFPQALVANEGFAASETDHALAFATILASFVSYGLLLCTVSLAAFLRRHVPLRGIVVAGATVLFALLFSNTGVGLTLAPAGYGLLLSAAVGALLGAALVRFDALTVFSGYFLFGLIGWLNEGWLVAGSPVWEDLLLGLLFVAALAGLGLVGVWSGKTGRETEDYTPSYITELAERERLQRDVEIAEEVQRSFLPRRMPQIEGLELAALCLPAREVGGDYYDFIELEGGRLGVVIGDVSGKGIEASFYMTLAKGFLQTLGGEDHTPAEVLRRLNALFRRNAPSGTFITMIYGVVDPAEGTFRFARAGHNPLAHCRAGADGGPQTMDDGASSDNGRAERERRPTKNDQRATHLLRPRGMAIGLADGPQFDDALEEVVLPLRPGDALVLYTDGFPEARSADGREFGEERIRERIQKHGHRPAQQLLQTLADDVHTFVESAGRHDDMTMVVIKHRGDAARPERPTYDVKAQAPSRTQRPA